MEKKKNIRRIPMKYALPFLAAAVLAVLWGGRSIQAALQTGEEAVSVHVPDEEIETSTLAIGSHLIHIDGLSDSLYQIAMESCNHFNQDQMYYKSELAQGAWFEISTATSILEITSSGSPVDKSVIEALEFTHKTGADCVTIDLLTGKAVCPYDINDPYDLQNMEELEPIRIQYELLQKKSKKTDADKQYIGLIQDLFASNIRDELTDDCDRIVEGLESYRKGLSDREKPAAWSAAVDTVMGSTDARRRVRSLETLDGLLDTLNQRVSGIDPLRDLTESEQEAKEMAEEQERSWADPREWIETVDAQVVEAVGAAIGNVQASISDYSAKIIEEGETAASQARYRYSGDLESSGKEGKESGCDTATENLCNLDNITAGKVVNRNSELADLSGDLVNAAKELYQGKLAAGVSDEYLAAKEAGAAQSALSQYLENQKSDTDAARLEYQTMLSALFERMSNEAAQNDVLNRIDQVPALRALPPMDAAYSYQTGTVEAHLLWLKQEYGELAAQSGAGTEMDGLKNALSDLQRQKQDALDSNDLAEAKRLDAEMEAKQQDIDDLAGRLTNVLANANASQSEKAKALAGLGSGSAASKIQKLTEEMTDDLLSGGADSESLENQMAALSALGELDPDAAKAGINGLKDVLQAVGASSGAGSGSGSGTQGASQGAGAGSGSGAQGASSGTGVGSGSGTQSASPGAGDGSGSGADTDAGSGAGDGNGSDGGSGLIDDSLADSLLSDLAQIENGLPRDGDVPSVEELRSLLLEILGGRLEDAGDAEQVSALLAVEWYGQEKKSRELLEYAVTLAERIGASNSYLYRKYAGQASAYVSLKAVGSVLGYRYVFNDSRRTVTLQRSKDYYIFTAGQAQYEIFGGEKKNLSGKAGLMGTIYIRSGDCEKQFGISGEYIEKSDWGVAATALVKTRAREIYNELKERG